MTENDAPPEGCFYLFLFEGRPIPDDLPENCAGVRFIRETDAGEHVVTDFIQIEEAVPDSQPMTQRAVDELLETAKPVDW